MKGKEYRRPMPAGWWLKKRSYTLFMVRELTALFVAGYAIFLLTLVYQAQQGPEAFVSFIQGLKSPLSLVLHLLALLMAIYHSVTWFNLTPKALVVWRGENAVPPTLIAASHYVVWVLLSVVIVGIVLMTAKG
jgi:fumarate reductase subunit C